MRLGIFAKTFERPSFAEIFTAIKSHGLSCVQFNFSCAGLPALPDAIDGALVQSIRGELDRQGLTMAAVSGTCNLIHPDAARRSKDLSRLEGLIRVCPGLGTSIVTLCTGTRDPHDMWREHPDNGSVAAWSDLRASLEQLLPVAEKSGVALGVEPEPANVIDSAVKARKLLDEVRSPSLKIVYDAANLLQPGTLGRQSDILAEAGDLLGPEVVLAHAKDLDSVETGRHPPAGKGAIDWAVYLSVLRRAGFDGSLILHSLREPEVPSSVAFLQNQIGATSAVLHSRKS